MQLIIIVFRCHYHLHQNCGFHRASNRVPPLEMIEAKEREKAESLDWAKRHGYSVQSMHECEWLEMKRSKPEIVQYLSAHLLMNEPASMSFAQILKRVREDASFFAYLEVDVSIELGSEAWERCSECCPIYRKALFCCFPLFSSIA